MLLLVIIVTLILLTQSEAVKISAIRFKNPQDEIRFQNHDGPDEVIKWIVDLNDISYSITGRGIVVTSWFRDDNTYHNGGHAVDIRRLSQANASDPQPYTQAQVNEIEQRALALGIPIHPEKVGTSEDHFHVGPITFAGS